MEDSIEHRLSALLDGETSEFETRRLIEEINRRPEIKNLWIRMNKTKSLLAAEIDFSPRNISSTVIEELDSSSIKQIKFSKDEKSKQLKYYGFAFGVLLSLGLVFQPLMIQEKESFKSTSVIPALSIGNTPVSSNESYLEEIGNNLKGSLKKIEFIEDGDIDIDEVGFGNKVTVLEEGKDEPEIYNLLGPIEFELDSYPNIVTYHSPFAQEMIGQEVGEHFTLDIEGKDIKFTVQSIEKVEIVKL